MRRQRTASLGHFGYWLALLALLCTGCERAPQTAPQQAQPGQEYHFTGTWTATGERQTMVLGTGREAMIFSYTGSLLLGGEQRLKRGFKAEVIGFADSRSGMQGRCVWTDERGDQIFSELHSEPNHPEPLIKGQFIGGTGRFIGVVGEYTFRWQRLIETEHGQVSGRVVDLKGWARLASPAPAGGQQ